MGMWNIPKKKRLIFGEIDRSKGPPRGAKNVKKNRRFRDCSWYGGSGATPWRSIWSFLSASIRPS